MMKGDSKPANVNNTSTTQNQKYGKISTMINNDIRDQKAGPLKSRQAVRNYAQSKYEQAGLTSKQVATRMSKKDAGHQVSKQCGGRDSASNFMWEDRHDNRSHGSKPITKEEMKRAGRL